MVGPFSTIVPYNSTPLDDLLNSFRKLKALDKKGKIKVAAVITAVVLVFVGIGVCINHRKNIENNLTDLTYDKNRYDANVTNKEWYKTDVDTRYTDAIDNYNTREKIDDEIAEVTNKTATTIDKMDSTTPTMGISVEYTTNQHTNQRPLKYLLHYIVQNVMYHKSK